MFDGLEPFPDVKEADDEGLIAVGGDLSPERLVLAYSNGIFPWYSEGRPILWWSPDPRMVLYPAELKVSRSMNKVLDQKTFRFTMDQEFGLVIRNCADVKRPDQTGTWITDEMFEAYIQMHQKGLAHSIEVWEQGELVGGLYGISMGRIFFGESMFHKVSNASKAGFIRFVLWCKDVGIEMIDCQVPTRHLRSLGAKNIPRTEFIEELKRLIEQPMNADWKFP